MERALSRDTTSCISVNPEWLSEFRLLAGSPETQMAWSRVRMNTLSG
jgi:hypothetical protein